MFFLHYISDQYNFSLDFQQQMTTAPKSYSQQPRSRAGSSGAAAQYPGVYPTTTMQGVAQAQPPPLIRATVHSNLA